MLLFICALKMEPNGEPVLNKSTLSSPGTFPNCPRALGSLSAHLGAHSGPLPSEVAFQTGPRDPEAFNQPVVWGRSFKLPEPESALRGGSGTGMSCRFLQHTIQGQSKMEFKSIRGRAGCHIPRDPSLPPSSSSQPHPRPDHLPQGRSFSGASRIPAPLFAELSVILEALDGV